MPSYLLSVNCVEDIAIYSKTLMYQSSVIERDRA